MTTGHTENSPNEEPMKDLRLRLPETLYQALLAAAKRHDLPLGEWILNGINMNLRASHLEGGTSLVQFEVLEPASYIIDELAKVNGRSFEEEAALVLERFAFSVLFRDEDAAELAQEIVDMDWELTPELKEKLAEAVKRNWPTKSES